MRHHELLELHQIADQGTLQARLVELAADLEFDRVSVAVVHDEGSAEHPSFNQLGNAPLAFLEKYLSVEDARRDPVMRRLKTSTIPFAYDQSTYVNCHAGDVWEVQAEFGYKTGLATATRTNQGRYFLFGVDRSRKLPKDDRVFAHTMASFQLLATFCCDAALRCMSRTQMAEVAPTLTGRESEILKWTLEGKSSWVVGAIIGISESTVNFHLRNAMSKLGVSSKHVAAARAASMGLI